MSISCLRKVDIKIATRTFYQRLFAEFPKIRSMFKNEDAQKQMFEIALKSILAKLDDPAELNSYLKVLGEKHKMLGILPLHMEYGLASFVNAVRAGNPGINEEDVDTLIDVYQNLMAAMGYPNRGDVLARHTVKESGQLESIAN